ncbi:SAM-dependent methyltransferase [Mycobacterium asiaticum]|uniref:SAM-dependent methyltransferase n=1 Tax=Mycobacterium asiaticum TaxID=1790 RepID=UPI000AA1BA8A|nr:SAM-dependent methyltransferase [Mycobacterium asiaticum]
MNVNEVPTGVGWTGLMTAFSRAHESLRKDRMFDDPLAAAVVTTANGIRSATHKRLPRLGPATNDGSSGLWNLFSFYFAHRTVFYDSRVLNAIDAGCRQIVLLGAGFDGRAFRLGLPGEATVFEMDQASVLGFKERILLQHNLVPSCPRVTLAADLREEIAGPLMAAGFRPDQRTLWIAEGLLMYFTQAEANRLLDRVSALSAVGSHFISEYFTAQWNFEDVNYELLDEMDQAVWDLLTWEFPSDPLAQEPGDWLASHGWEVRTCTTVGEFGRASRREVPPQFATADGPDIFLFDGIKGDGPKSSVTRQKSYESL